MTAPTRDANERLRAAYEVMTDVVLETQVMVAVLTGAVPLQDALRVSGLDRARWEALLAASAAGGRECVAHWLAHGWRMDDGRRAHLAIARAAGVLEEGWRP